MAPLNPISTWNERGIEEIKKPLSKFYFLCEGSKTERYYFEALFEYLNKRNTAMRVLPLYVERTEEDETVSCLIRLAEYASEIRADEEKKYGFNDQLDKTVLIFDADIYKNRSKEFKELLENVSADNIIGVTQPSIELFLLLHRENAYKQYIAPKKEELFENKKVSNRRRFVDKYFSECYGVNPKTNSAVAGLAEDYLLAIQEEKQLNKNVSKAAEQLTSNIGEIIELLQVGV